MTLNRRNFLQLGLAQTVLAQIPVSAKGKVTTHLQRRQGPSILQGATDETSTQFSILFEKSAPLEFQILDSSGRSRPPQSVQLLSLNSQAKGVWKVSAQQLSRGETYTLLVLSNGVEIDRRSFGTLDLNAPAVKFALCSCMDENNHEPGIWQDLIAQKPDVIFFIGDSVYCDKDPQIISPDTADRLWRRFSESRSTLEIYFSQRLIPILAVWDDHDFGQNDVDSSYPFLKESQLNFQSFFAQDPTLCPAIERGPGISTSIRLAGQQFFLMDDRSYRLKGQKTNRYGHWGRGQEEWMLAKLNEFQGPTWIFNGSQLFPEMIFKESFSGDHPAQFKGVLDQIRNSGKKVIFGSGDVHFSEISKIEAEQLGYFTYELTSSAIHSKPFPGVPDFITNKRRLVSVKERNYLLVESRAEGLNCDFTVSSRSTGGRENFKRRFQV